MAYSGSKPLKYSCSGCGVLRYFQIELCAACTKQKNRIEFGNRATKQLVDAGYNVLTDLTTIPDNKAKIKVHRIECGHSYEARLSNILSGASICSICGPTARMKPAMQAWLEKYAAHDTTDFARFKRKVRNLTEQTYKANIDVINPLKHKRSRPDVNPDAWQLDHKVSIFEAYKQGWTPEQASALENLQMLPALENFKKQRF